MYTTAGFSLWTTQKKKYIQSQTPTLTQPQTRYLLQDVFDCNKRRKWKIGRHGIVMCLLMTSNCILSHSAFCPSLRSSSFKVNADRSGFYQIWC